MVGKKDKTERAIELIDLAKTKRKKPDLKQWGYKIRELSIDVRKIKDKEKRAKLIRNFLSKHPGIKESVYRTQNWEFSKGEHTFDDIVLIETFISYEYWHEWFVETRVKWTGVRYFRRYSKGFYDPDERNELMKFLKEIL